MTTKLDTYAFDVAEFSTGGDGRNVTALAVPFNATPQDGRKVAFLPGSFKNTIQGKRQTQIPFFGLHPTGSEQLPVGHSVRFEETADGLLAEFRISSTPRGDEVLTLIKDGVLHSVSVGVIPIRHKRDGGRINFQEVKLNHVAAVPDPAFVEAQVVDVHSEQLPTPGMSLDIARARLAVIQKRVR